jgi:tRNA G10  N-methylase Trm11
VVNRPAGGPRSKGYARAELDWYVEPARAVEQLFHAIDFENDVIWDGSCGRGTVLEVASRYGHEIFGSDLRDRRGRYANFNFYGFPFQRQDILEATEANFSFRPWSYVSNPPYNYTSGIAERIMRHVLERLRPRRAAFLVPIAFLCSAARHRFFMQDFRPSHICIHSERVTCPPGHLLDELATPFEGGMADYVWVCFRAPHKWRTETVWLEPGSHPYPPRRRTT